MSPHRSATCRTLSVSVGTASAGSGSLNSTAALRPVPASARGDSGAFFSSPFPPLLFLPFFFSSRAGDADFSSGSGVMSVFASSFSEPPAGMTTFTFEPPIMITSPEATATGSLTD